MPRLNPWMKRGLSRCRSALTSHMQGSWATGNEAGVFRRRWRTRTAASSATKGPPSPDLRMEVLSLCGPRMPARIPVPPPMSAPTATTVDTASPPLPRAGSRYLTCHSINWVTIANLFGAIFVVFACVWFLVDWWPEIGPLGVLGVAAAWPRRAVPRLPSRAGGSRAPASRKRQELRPFWVSHSCR